MERKIYDRNCEEESEDDFSGGMKENKVEVA
jgi:hypothetical protein